jgi:hypothetical protein
LCRAERVIRRNLHIGLHADTFPIGLGNGIDRPRKAHANREPIINSMIANGMRLSVWRVIGL